MRKHIVAGNWKMNCTFDEADELINGIMDARDADYRLPAVPLLGDDLGLCQ